jgi:RNA polymerase-binding transcription factor DksA
MAKFLTGEELENSICGIIRGAKEKLIIVSPFIKLDDFFIQIFESQAQNSQLHILIVFGKNEQDKSRSLNSNDFEFFKKFPNVSIIYVANLHAKYYGNESKGIITSINMYDHSFRNNIEFGVLSENTILDKLKGSADNDAWYECLKIADNGEPVFIKRPMFKSKLIFIKDYINSKVLLDKTADFYGQGYRNNNEIRKLIDFPASIDYAEQATTAYTREEYKEQKNNSKTEPVYKEENNSRNSQHNNYEVGYCIRTGVQIPFNPAKPFCLDAYRNWAQFENWDYSENYCHRTGKKSYGKTSMRYPML